MPCDEFVENTWRRDLCANCLQTRQRHPGCRGKHVVNEVKTARVAAIVRRSSESPTPAVSAAVDEGEVEKSCIKGRLEQAKTPAPAVKKRVPRSPVPTSSTASASDDPAPVARPRARSESAEASPLTIKTGIYHDYDVSLRGNLGNSTVASVAALYDEVATNEETRFYDKPASPDSPDEENECNGELKLPTSPSKRSSKPEGNVVVRTDSVVIAERNASNSIFNRFLRFGRDSNRYEGKKQAAAAVETTPREPTECTDRSTDVATTRPRPKPRKPSVPPPGPPPTTTADCLVPPSSSSSYSTTTSPTGDDVSPTTPLHELSPASSRHKARPVSEVNSCTLGRNARRMAVRPPPPPVATTFSTLKSTASFREQERPRMMKAGRGQRSKTLTEGIKSGDALITVLKCSFDDSITQRKLPSPPPQQPCHTNLAASAVDNIYEVVNESDDDLTPTTDTVRYIPPERNEATAAAQQLVIDADDDGNSNSSDYLEPVQRSLQEVDVVTSDLNGHAKLRENSPEGSIAVTEKSENHGTGEWGSLLDSICAKYSSFADLESTEKPERPPTRIDNRDDRSKPATNNAETLQLRDDNYLCMYSNKDVLTNQKLPLTIGASQRRMESLMESVLHELAERRSQFAMRSALVSDKSSFRWNNFKIFENPMTSKTAAFFTARRGDDRYVLVVSPTRRPDCPRNLHLFSPIHVFRDNVPASYFPSTVVQKPTAVSVLPWLNVRPLRERSRAAPSSERMRLVFYWLIQILGAVAALADLHWAASCLHMDEIAVAETQTGDEYLVILPIATDQPPSSQSICASVRRLMALMASGLRSRTLELVTEILDVGNASGLSCSWTLLGTALWGPGSDEASQLLESGDQEQACAAWIQLERSAQVARQALAENSITLEMSLQFRFLCSLTSPILLDGIRKLFKK